MTGPSYRFRLERVRALRERAEDAAKQAFASAMQDRVRSELALEEAERRLAFAREAQREALSQTTTASELLARQAYLERSELVRRASQEELGRRELVVSQRRGELTEAARERQALERLKEHRRLEHQREQARLEAQALDEMALNGYRRRVA
ncbi:MAG TPA: flagellar export protein FliJ [Solirubrobacteraceae bacterium]|nr:flagellar export protein FliJ [Solirubrobacteraceae bacterium]